MKRRFDLLFYFGVAFLVLLALTALFGPGVRSRQLSVGARPVNAVYDAVTQPYQPIGAQISEVGGMRVRPDPKGLAVVTVEDGSSADRRVKPRTFITSVDGEQLAGREFREAVLLLRSKTAPTLGIEDATGGFSTVSLDWGAPPEPRIASLPLGSDQQGRDVFARLAAGARVSLYVGLVVQAIALLVGITVGVLGVFSPRWISTPLLRFTDAMFAFPDILLAILIVGVLSMGLTPVIVALSITSWPSLARLVSAQVASIKDREYVVAAKAAGASDFYLVTRHILPQLSGILLAVSMIEIAGTILAESTLSFLGIGVQAPDPSWGDMINQARTDMNSHPIALLWPCLILSLTIFALNFVGDGIRSAMDPKKG